MPKKNSKAALKKKQKKQGGKGKGKGQKNQNNQNKKPEIEEEKKMDEKASPILTKKALLDKYDIRLGPPGYIPAPPGTPKSIHIDEFSMVDPGGGRELLTKTEINIRENSIYGLVGKNGFGKTTLLKLMYNYEIEGFPKHIRMVIVNQEELLSDNSVLKCVLEADDIRNQLISTEDRLTLMQEQVEDEAAQDEINEILELCHA